MTERAQKIYDAWEKEWVKSNHLPNHEHRALAAAIRAMSDSFVYDDNGLAWFTADDFKKFVDELENLK
jgi:hypothetical protein